jgi:hypothetical protein
LPITNKLVAANLTIVSLFQLFWTPDIIIHDLVSFNKPEILNQATSLVGEGPKGNTHWSVHWAGPTGVLSGWRGALLIGHL